MLAPHCRAAGHSVPSMCHTQTNAPFGGTLHPDIHPCPGPGDAATLYCLATGAVQFPRAETVARIRNRWLLQLHRRLSRPDIAAGSADPSPNVLSEALPGIPPLALLYRLPSLRLPKQAVAASSRLFSVTLPHACTRCVLATRRSFRSRTRILGRHNARSVDPWLSLLRRTQSATKAVAVASCPPLGRRLLSSLAGLDCHVRVSMCPASTRLLPILAQCLQALILLAELFFDTVSSADFVAWLSVRTFGVARCRRRSVFDRSRGLCRSPRCLCGACSFLARVFFPWGRAELAAWALCASNIIAHPGFS